VTRLWGLKEKKPTIAISYRSRPEDGLKIKRFPLVHNYSASRVDGCGGGGVRRWNARVKSKRPRNIFKQPTKKCCQRGERGKLEVGIRLKGIRLAAILTLTTRDRKPFGRCRSKASGDRAEGEPYFRELAADLELFKEKVWYAGEGVWLWSSFFARKEKKRGGSRGVNTSYQPDEQVRGTLV